VLGHVEPLTQHGEVSPHASRPLNEGERARTPERARGRPDRASAHPPRSADSAALDRYRRAQGS
jgi:hypothetical protein